jgi:hypothetical protein
MSVYGSLLYDLLHKWPLVMFIFWMFPLFFAGWLFELARFGIYGRGIPVSSGKYRLHGAINKIGSALLAAFAALIWAAFVYWLCFALYKKFMGLD